MAALVLWLLAAVCFGLAACGVTAGRFNLVAAGLLFASLTFLVPEMIATR